MTREIVIDNTGFGVRGALIEDDRLIDIIDIDHAGNDVTDRLFRVRVAHIDTRLNAAFLDYGGAEHGFLAAKDARYVARIIERRPINKLVHEGQWIVVQGLREPDHGKGPRFTTDVKFFGMFMVYRPFGHGVEVSVKLRGLRQQEMLDRGVALFGEDSPVMIRQQAVDVEDAILEAEFAELEGRWRRLQQGFSSERGPCRLEGDESPQLRLVRQVFGAGLDIIKIADPGLFVEMRAFLELLPEIMRPGLERLDPARGAFSQCALDEAIERDFAREIPLDRGGRLIIEETAACVAIDVDGGNRDAQDIDLDAAREIARLVRLRHLGGTIIVDFVDLPTKPQRQQLENALKRAFKGDQASVQIYPMSPLGLVQLSRARHGARWSTRWFRACPECGGDGHVPSLRRRSEALWRELQDSQARPATIRMATDLFGFAQKEAAALFGDLPMKQDSDLPPGSFIVEMLR